VTHWRSLQPGQSGDPFDGSGTGASGNEYSTLRLRADLARYLADVGCPWRVELDAVDGVERVGLRRSLPADGGDEIVWMAEVDSRPPEIQLAEWKRAVDGHWGSDPGLAGLEPPGVWCAPA
jgi:hypothetical protein